MLSPAPVTRVAPSLSTLARPADDASDAALVEEMLGGSRAAWRVFHARYDRLIFRCIVRVTSRFTRTVSQDDVSEICATLRMQLCANDMAKLRSFDERRGRRLASWIGLLAVNCAYDHLRSIKHEGARASLDECDELDGETLPADELIDLKQRAQHVQEILAEFSDKDREFVALYFGEGLDAEQVAARMQISVKTVYSKKHKIQSRIGARLDRDTAPTKCCARARSTPNASAPSPRRLPPRTRLAA